MRIFKSTLLIILATFGFFFTSCDKSDDTNNSLTRDKIEIGDHSNMIINYYDTILIVDYNSSKYINLDLNKDGIEDIQFESKLWGTLASGQHTESIVKSLTNDIQFFGYFSNDTSFFHKTTSVHNDLSNYVEIHIMNNYSCQRATNNDSVLNTTSQFHVFPINQGDEIEITDNFNSDTLILIEDSYCYGSSSYEKNSDTLIVEYMCYNKDCNSFLLDEEKYIGVRFKNESKLGWIKISISEKYKIHILESGIQN